MENEKIRDYVEKVNTRGSGYSEVEKYDLPLVEGVGRRARLTEAGKKAAASYAYALISAPEVLDLPAVETTFEWAKETLKQERDMAEEAKFRDYVRLLNSSLRMRERHLRNKLQDSARMEDSKQIVNEMDLETISNQEEKKPKFVSLEVMKEKMANLKKKSGEVLDDVKSFSKEHWAKVGWGMIAVGVLGACTYLYTDQTMNDVGQKVKAELEMIPVVQMATDIFSPTETVAVGGYLANEFDESEPLFHESVFNIDETAEIAEVEAVDSYAWLKQGLGKGPAMDLSEPFKMVLPAETAQVFQKKKPIEFMPETIDVHRYHTVSEAEEADWADFLNSPFTSKNDIALQQGNNNRAVLYGHSGSVAGVEWPFDFVKNATWYEDKIIGKTIEFYSGNYKYVYQIEQITTITKKDFEANSGEFPSDENRPVMKNMEALGIDEDILSKPGIDFVVCGGKGVSMKDYRTIMSTVLVSQEWVEINEVSTANYYENEYYESTLQNIETAANMVNSDFDNDPFSPGETWSYLEAVNYFADDEWVQPPGKLYAAGACDVATMMVRATESFSRSIGLSFNRLDNGNMRETWGNSLFEVNLWPHSFYERMPVDMVAVEAQSKKPDQGNSDMTIAFSDNVNGVIIPVDAELRFVTKKDEDGNYKVVVESNYPITQWQAWVKQGLTFTKGN